MKEAVALLGHRLLHGPTRRCTRRSRRRQPAAIGCYLENGEAEAKLRAFAAALTAAIGEDLI